MKFENPLKKFLKAPETEEKNGESQLLQVVSDLAESKGVLSFIAKEIFEKSGKEFKSEREVRKLFENVEDKKEAFRLARLVEEKLGEGTLRILSFTSKGVDAEKNVLKILRKNLEKASFEKRAERGLYLGILEDYDVQWDLEKTARDAWQNFFDANDQTLDGIKSNFKTNEEGAKATLWGPKNYDWRELVHIGATTKKDSPTSAGGFGEGAKILALVLLRDFGAKEVKFSSADWEANYYLDKVPEETYYREVRGLFLKKSKREPKKGSALEIAFEGEKAQENLKVIESAQELFYSSKNPDFQKASFDNKKTGGFKILVQKKGEEAKGVDRKSGHLYIAGQRTHHDKKDKWETAEDLNIWTWEKIVPKDSDRGMITREEMKDKVIPFIVESMDVSSAKKSVYDFKPLWDTTWWSYETSYRLIERLVDRLEVAGEKLEFEKDYLANDMGFGGQWITTLLKQEGYKTCPSFMSKIGMKKISERFKELQSHFKVESTEQEKSKIDLLQGAAKEIGLGSEEIKEVWLFSAENEKSIFHGQCNPIFYWMAKESLNTSFLDAIHTYVHEAAHKEGAHGDPKFEYRLQEVIKKIQKIILEKRERFEGWEREWEKLSKTS